MRRLFFEMYHTRRWTVPLYDLTPLASLVCPLVAVVSPHSYGLITAIVILNQVIPPTQGGLPQYSLFTGFSHLAAGLSCGLSCLGSGMAIGLAGDSGVRGFGYYDYQSKKVQHKSSFMMGNVGGSRKSKKNQGSADQLFVAMVLIQVFAGNLALYGLITSIILTQTGYVCEY
jgi:ATP synthase proteolipid subunit